MRAGSRCRHDAAVQVLVEISSSGGVNGRVHGSVQLPDGVAVPFVGWLELLRLLEDCTTNSYDHTLQEGG
jgi:hypothetical protein